MRKIKTHRHLVGVLYAGIAFRQWIGGPAARPKGDPELQCAALEVYVRYGDPDDVTTG